MRWVSLGLLVACGSSSAKQPDARPIDAPLDVSVDAPPMATGAHYHYILDSVSVPTTSTMSREDGLDLNGDGTVDNQLGAVDAAIKSQAGIDVQAFETLAVDEGTVLMLADLQATDLTTATNAGFTMYAGENPNPAPCNGSADTTCRRHLTGSGTFDVAGAPRDPQLIGAVANGVFAGGPGQLSMQLSIGGGTPELYTLHGARAELTPTATTVMTGKLGGAITKDDVDAKVVPAIATSMNAVIARDCTMLSSPPDCGCFQGSTGATALAFYDTMPRDCTVSPTEIAENSLIMSLLQPDVTIDGKPCISYGIAVTAVGATFTP